MIENISLERMIGTRLGNYRLERSLGQGKWGPIFLARTEAADTTYLIRILAGLTPAGARDRQAYLERFQHQASQIATLQHPNILPLLGYGSYQGMPYLVSPHISMRSLRTRLAKSVSLDVVTVGRYLDQIAATLDYAHQHGVLHGNLSIDCIFIRLDGQLVVADFGVASLLLIDNKDVLRDQLDQWSGTCAPEQLLGKGYLLGASDHATFAVEQSDATSAMRLHAGLMAIALSNIKGWVTTIDQDVLNLHKDPSNLTKVPEIAMLADDAYYGVDANNDGQIEPVVGEAGALTAYLQGQLMSTIALAPGS